MGQQVHGDDIEVLNCHFVENYRWGAFSSSGDNVRFENCTFKENIDETPASFVDVAGSGLVISGGAINAPDGTWIDNCVADDNEKDGFNIGDDLNTTIEDCTSKYNKRQGLLTIESAGLTVQDGLYDSNEATGIQVENGADDIEIKNVEIKNHDSTTSCGEGGIWIDCSTNILIEDCNIHDNIYGIRITEQNVGATSDIIIRFNRIHDNNAMSCKNGSNGNNVQGGISYEDVSRLTVYHNTIWNNGHSGPVQTAEKWGGFGADTTSTQSSAAISFKNNILGDHTALASIHMIQWDATSEMGDVDYNIYNDPPNSAAYHHGSSTDDFDDYQDATGIDEDNSWETTTAPINTTSHLLYASSSALSAAGPLTSVKGSGGTTVELYSSTYFVVGDTVKTSAGTTATVNSVNYISGDVTFSAFIATGSDIYLSRTGNSGVDIGWDQF